MVLGGPSAFLRHLFPPEEPCECNTLTVILPDFDSVTVKNLLALLYTGTLNQETFGKPFHSIHLSSSGTSAGDCDESELRQLLHVLGMTDLLKATEEEELHNSSGFKVSRMPSSMSKNKRTLSSVVPLTSANNQASSHSPRDTAVCEQGNDEMVEVTPEVQMYFGNHFMADMMNGGSGAQSEDDSSPAVAQQQQQQQPAIRIKKASNLLASSALVDQENSIDKNGTVNGDDQFLCRLCGRTTPSAAALFAHLLYPHYAHLWRTEIPHRANQYLCKQCPYTTTKRQHFVQHVAKVHEDLKKKLMALGENLEVLENLNPKSNPNTERIISKIAKFKSEDSVLEEEYSNVNSPIAAITTEENIVTTLPSTNLTSTPVGGGGGGGLTAKEVNSKLELTSFNLIPGRFPRGYKPFVKCRLCGKGWKGKDNFFTHLVSTHFKHMWSEEVPKHADMYHCHVGSCQYQSKYRYNFLFHLAGKHKQLKEKLANDGVSLDVLVPIEVDEVDEEMLAGGSPTILKTQSLAMQQHFLDNETNMQKFLAATAPPPNSGGGGRTPSHGKYSAANSTVRLICRVCKKISFNHTCHRQHVVSKHFQDFWADKSPDQTGLFHCHHCDYQTPNRSVFVIHLAYTHSELKTKLKESGSNPEFADPDVYGKRKYRRSHYDNTQRLVNAIQGAKKQTPIRPSPPKVPKMEQVMQPPITITTSASTSANAVNDQDKHKYTCRLCKTEFGKQKAIVEHLALAHFYQVWEDDRPENGSFYVPPEGPFVCPHCPFTSTSRAAFIAHMVNQHEALKSVMSLQYGDKTVEDLYTVSGSSSGAEDETYDEGEDDEDDIDDDEENAHEDMEDMDDEMDGQTSDIEYKMNDDPLAGNGMAPAEAASGW